MAGDGWDQELGAVNESLDTLIALFRKEIAETGEMEATGNMMLSLLVEGDRFSMTGLAVAAIRRLALAGQDDLHEPD